MAPALPDLNELSQLTGVLPPEVLTKVDDLMILLKAIGIAFIVYIVYLLFTFILNLLKYNKLKSMERKIDYLFRKEGGYKALEKQQQAKLQENTEKKHSKKIRHKKR